MKQRPYQPFSRANRWITLRYLMPLITLLLTAMLCFVPCLRYISAAEGTLANQSLFEMLGDRFRASRGNLFGERAELSPQGIRFSKTELILLLASVLLALAGLCLVIYVTARAFAILRDPKKNDAQRAFFITLVPNRGVYFVYQLLFLPLLLYPRIWLWLIRGIMDYPITLHLSFAEPWMVFGVLYLGQIILSAVTARTERRRELDPFRRRYGKEEPEEPDEEETHRESLPREAAQNEKRDRILRLLTEDDGESQAQEKDI